MTDAECAETLSEFRRLNLGPELCAALDHAIWRMSDRPQAFALGPLISPTDGRPYGVDLRELSARVAMR